MNQGPFAYYTKTENPAVAYRIPVADAVALIELDAIPFACWISKDTAFALASMVLVQCDERGNIHALGETGFR